MRRAAVVLALALAGCGGHDVSPMDAGFGDQNLDDPQRPPQGAAAVDAWLSKGFYTSWHCEVSPHPGRTPSPHGTARVCDNDLLSGFTGAGEFPVGAASVKQLFDASNALAGFSLYVKTAPGGCDSYYYYERFGSGAASTDKLGSRTCTGCHGQAAPPQGHDCVYTIVQ